MVPPERTITADGFELQFQVPFGVPDCVLVVHPAAAAWVDVVGPWGVEPKQGMCSYLFNQPTTTPTPDQMHSPTTLGTSCWPTC